MTVLPTPRATVIAEARFKGDKLARVRELVALAAVEATRRSVTEVHPTIEALRRNEFPAFAPCREYEAFTRVALTPAPEDAAIRHVARALAIDLVVPSLALTRLRQSLVAGTHGALARHEAAVDLVAAGSFPSLAAASHFIQELSP